MKNSNLNSFLFDKNPSFEDFQLSRFCIVDIMIKNSDNKQAIYFSMIKNKSINS